MQIFIYCYDYMYAMETIKSNPLDLYGGKRHVAMSMQKSLQKLFLNKKVYDNFVEQGLNKSLLEDIISGQEMPIGRLYRVFNFAELCHGGDDLGNILKEPSFANEETRTYWEETFEKYPIVSVGEPGMNLDLYIYLRAIEEMAWDNE